MDYINKIKNVLNDAQFQNLTSIDELLKLKMKESLYRHSAGTLNYSLDLLDRHYFPGIFSGKEIIRKQGKVATVQDTFYGKNSINKISARDFINKTCLASILHDYGKVFDIEELVKIAIVHLNELSEFERKCYPCLHAFLAPYLIKRDFNIEDKDILHSVQYHTTGSLEMNALDRIIYISDKLEDGRNYENISYLRELSFNDPDLCLLEVYKSNIIYVINKNYLLHPDTSRIWNYICGGYKNAT